MKKVVKNQPGADSYSVTEAAASLGVSTPTLKRMVAEGRLESFRTPGGHIRISGESIEAAKDGKQNRPRPVRDASSVLQNRRERLEELTLEAQEIRARREVTEQRRKDQEEAERREAEAQSREDEAAQRQAEIELERERLEHEEAQQEARREREERQEQDRREAATELAAFRCRWLDKAGEAVSTYKYQWLSPTQRKEVLESLESEIERRQPADEPRMIVIIARSLEALVEPLRAQHSAQERRQRVTERALCGLPYSATEAERVRAKSAIRDALQRFDATADDSEMRLAAEDAIRPIKRAVERREMEGKLLRWAVNELRWGSDDRDKARLHRESAEILAELPEDATEEEAKEELEPTIREACRIVERRQAQEERQERKGSLIRQGVAEVARYLAELRQEDEISAEDYLDSGLAGDLRDAVKAGLEDELTGDESSKEVRELAREIIDGEFE